MNVHYTSLAAARNVDKVKFDQQMKTSFYEACNQMSKKEVINALCVNQRRSIPVKLAA